MQNINNKKTKVFKWNMRIIAVVFKVFSNRSSIQLYILRHFLKKFFQFFFSIIETQ